MRVTIKGITPSTIAFNTLGIVIRGNNSNPKLYPESIARHIDVNNEDQLTEVNTLVNAGLIRVEVEEEDSPQLPKVTPELLVSTKADIQYVPEVEDTEEEAIEDAPQVSKTKHRGRPKGSKNKKNTKRTVKKITEEEQDCSAIVMTLDGAKRGKMKRSADGEISDSEITKASIEAMKKLEKEEELDKNLPDDIIDESQFAPEEQMGGDAIIGGEVGAKKVAMKNSTVPEAKQIKERSVEFIDQVEKDAEEKAKKAFIDNKNNEDDLDFLEY
jgi:hypothetical protein